MSNARPELEQMYWRRSLTALSHPDSQAVITAYTFASEANLSGLMAGWDAACLMAQTSNGVDADGLHWYEMALRYSLNTEPPDLVGSKDAYHFPGGPVDELLALLSLWFGCRFFVESYRWGELSPSSVPSVTRKPRRSRHWRPALDSFLASKGNVRQALPFLVQVVNLRAPDQKKVLLAAHCYHLALRSVGLDEQVAFVRLVSAVEAAADKTILPPNKDPFQRFQLKDLIQPGKLTGGEQQEFQKLFDVRKSRQKFIAFLERYSTGFFRGGRARAEHLRIRRPALPGIATAVYNARSAYLHAGTPLPLDHRFRGDAKFDRSGSGDSIHGGKRITAKERLPYFHFFQRLVRHCLLARIRQLTSDIAELDGHRS